MLEAPAVALAEDRAPIVKENPIMNHLQSYTLEAPAVALSDDRAPIVKAPPSLSLNHGVNLELKLSWACRDLQRHCA
jgi:hypothetical protein